MEIQEMVMKYKYHLLFTLIISIIVAAIIFIAPSFVTILAYFWPLFFSTALFLVAVIFFGKTSSPPSAAGTEFSGDKLAGEGILDYVAGQSGHHHHDLHENDQVLENFKHE